MEIEVYHLFVPRRAQFAPLTLVNYALLSLPTVFCHFPVFPSRILFSVHRLHSI